MNYSLKNFICSTIVSTIVSTNVSTISHNMRYLLWTENESISVIKSIVQQIDEDTEIDDTDQKDVSRIRSTFT